MSGPCVKTLFKKKKKKFFVSAFCKEFDLFCQDTCLAFRFFERQTCTIGIRYSTETVYTILMFCTKLCRKGKMIKTLHLVEQIMNQQMLVVTDSWEWPQPHKDTSILVWVMAWCRQAPSFNLSQCWPRCRPSYGVTKRVMRRFIYGSFQSSPNEPDKLVR